MSLLTSLILGRKFFMTAGADYLVLNQSETIVRRNQLLRGDVHMVRKYFLRRRSLKTSNRRSMDLVKPKSGAGVGTSCSGSGHGIFRPAEWSGQQYLGVEI